MYVFVVKMCKICAFLTKDQGKGIKVPGIVQNDTQHKLTQKTILSKKEEAEWEK